MIPHWTAVWFVLGLGTGTIAAFLGDSGHIPGWLLPLVVGLAGAVGGLVGAVLLRVAVRVLTGIHVAPGPRMHLLASVTGAVSMTLLAAPLGVAQPYAAMGGAAAGLISYRTRVFSAARRDRPSPPPRAGEGPITHEQSPRTARESPPD
jgi:uncharacterized membrane protein YeaQ/YmgE (transglycosylase-associated protein family)